MKAIEYIRAAHLHAKNSASAIRYAHSLSCKANRQFEEMVLIDLIGEAVALEKKLARMVDALKSDDSDYKDLKEARIRYEIPKAEGTS